MDFQTRKNKPFPELINYQPLYATEGSTTKSGCGFYVKKGLKFKSRKDLDLTYDDDDDDDDDDDENEFQSCWIEILNEKELILEFLLFPRKIQMIFFI